MTTIVNPTTTSAVKGRGSGRARPWITLLGIILVVSTVRLVTGAHDITSANTIRAAILSKRFGTRNGRKICWPPQWSG